jgi:hypothetical protein
MLEHFKIIDQFGSKVDLLYKHQSAFKTKIGATLTGLLIGLFIYFIIYFSQDMLNKTNPIIRSSYERHSDNITGDNLFAAITILDPLNQQIHEIDRYIDIQSRNFFTAQENTTITPLSVSKCEMEKHFLKFKNKLSEDIIRQKVMFGYSKCIDLNETQALSLDFLEVNNKMIDIIYLKCSNKTSKYLLYFRPC